MMIISKRRIAILADFPWAFFDEGATGRGGGQGATWLSQLAGELSKQDEFEIHWISLDRKGVQVRERQWGGQHFHLLPGLKLSVDLLLGYLPTKRRLFDFLSGIKPELVHCWGSERAYPAICSKLKVPTVFSLQGLLHHYFKLGLLPPVWQWRAIARWEPRYLRDASVVTCESNWGIDIIRRFSPGIDIRQVEYGVNSSFYNVAWQPDEKDPYALFVGALDRRKGIDSLIAAVSRLPNRRWRLRVAGEGPLRDELEAKNVSGVEWLGLARWDVLQNELAKATCLVLPTLADTSPNVVKEARVVGLPVITSPHGGQTDYVWDGENGFIVDPSDPDQIAAALSKLMDDPELSKTMGACRLEENRDYLRPARTAEGFLRIYRELLA